MKILPRYTYDQFARITGKSRRTIQSWAMQGKIPGLSGGDITLGALKAYLGMTTDEASREPT